MATKKVEPVKVTSLPSPAAAITVDVLLALAAQANPTKLRRLAELLGVPRSTLHRILRTLEAKGMVEHVGTGYSIGDRAQQLGARFRANQLPRIAGQIIEQLHRETGETVNLATPQPDCMLIVAAQESSAPLRMVSAVGKRDALHASALGKAYLAALPQEALVRVLKGISLTQATSNTIIDVDALLVDLEQTRARGYAVDDEESIVGVCCVGSAVRGEGGELIGALSVSGPSGRLSGATRTRWGRLVRRAAADLSRLLGASEADGGV